MVNSVKKKNNPKTYKAPPAWSALPSDVRHTIRDVANEYGIQESLIMARTSLQAIVEARHEAMRRLKNNTDYTLIEIGDFFGKHHTAVIYGIERAEERLRMTDIRLKTIASTQP